MKRNTAFFMAVFMIVGIIAGGVVFSVSANAETYNNNVPYVSPQPDWSVMQDYSLYCGTTSQFMYNPGFYVINVTNDDSITKAYYIGDIIYYVSNTNNGNNVSIWTLNSTQWAYSTAFSNPTEYDGVYYKAGYRIVEKNNSIPTFNSIEEIVSDYKYGSVEINEYSFSLEAGSVAYIEYSNQDISLNMTTTMPELSTVWIAGSQPDFWPSSQTYIGNVNTLPVINDTLNFTNWNRISWSRGEPRNILGQTKLAVYSDTVFYGGLKYLTIYNYPYYLTNLDKAEVELSGSIIITVTNAVSVTVFSALSGSINGVTNTIISNDGDDVSTDGQYTDTNGQIVTPVPGSGNYIPENSDLETVLSNLVSDIDTFFTGTWHHIRQMVTSAGRLPSMIVEMYSWLPEEYKAVLFSAFGIVVVVGILKVML